MNLKTIKKLNKEFKGDDLELPKKENLGMGVYDRYMNLTSQVSTWRRLSLLFAIMMCGSIGLFMMKSFEKQYIPYVIRMDSAGNVSSEILTNAKGDSTHLTEKETEYFLTSVISKLRNIPKDKDFYKARLLETYPYLTKNAKNKLEDFMDTKTNTNAVLEHGYTLNTKIKSFIKIQNDKYQVNWVESTYDGDGTKTFEVEYTCILDTNYVKVDSVEQIRTNPTGIVITDIEIKEVGK